MCASVPPCITHFESTCSHTVAAVQDGAELQPSEKGITLDPVEWEHLADALPDLQAALGSVNVNFQACVLHCVLNGLYFPESKTRVFRILYWTFSAS